MPIDLSKATLLNDIYLVSLHVGNIPMKDVSSIISEVITDVPPTPNVFKTLRKTETYDPTVQTSTVVVAMTPKQVKDLETKMIDIVKRLNPNDSDVDESYVSVLDLSEYSPLPEFDGRFIIPAPKKIPEMSDDEFLILVGSLQSRIYSVISKTAAKININLEDRGSSSDEKSRRPDGHHVSVSVHKTKDDAYTGSFTVTLGSSWTNDEAAAFLILINGGLWNDSDYRGIFPYTLLGAMFMFVPKPHADSGKDAKPATTTTSTMRRRV